MAWLINAALLVWVVEGVLLVVAVWMVRTGRLDPDRLSELAGRGLIPLMAFSQSLAAVLLGVGMFVRHRLHADPMSPFSRAWLATLLTGVLVFVTAALLLDALPTFRTLIHADVNVPIRRMTAHSVVGKQYWFSEETFQEDDVMGGLREINVETGMLFSLGTFSALGLLILHIQGALEDRS